MLDDLCELVALIGQAPPRTVGELAQALGQDRNAVAAGIEALVAAGVVRRWRVPAARRIVLCLDFAGVVQLALRNPPVSDA